jgi:hypothetical protein
MLQATVLANVTQRTNMTVARFADVGHMLVERQLSVEGDAQTPDDCRRFNSGIRYLKRGHVFHPLLPATRRELDDFRFARVEFKAVFLQPRVNTGDAAFQLTDLCRKISFPRCNVYLRIIRVLVMINTE